MQYQYCSKNHLKCWACPRARSLRPASLKQREIYKSYIEKNISIKLRRVRTEKLLVSHDSIQCYFVPIGGPPKTVLCLTTGTCCIFGGKYLTKKCILNWKVKKNLK